MTTRDSDSVRQIRLKLRLPDSIALALDAAAAAHGGKELFLRAAVSAVIIGLKIRKAPPTIRRGASSVVAVSVNGAVLKLWRHVAAHLWTRGSVDQLVAAALSEVLVAA